MDSERDPGSAGGPRRHLVVLVRLQGLDRERDAKQRLIDDTDRIVAARARDLEEARARAAKAHAELNQAKVRAHEREVDLRARGDSVQKLELQLNTAKTNQEYQALLGHIRKLKDESARQEDDTLALYDEIERREAEVSRADARVAELDAEHREFVAKCERDREEARAEIAATEDRRRELLAELPGDLRATYERLRAAREGLGIAAVEERTCTGCGMGIRPNDLAKLMACSQIVTCDSCQRILYVPTALTGT